MTNLDNTNPPIIQPFGKEIRPRILSPRQKRFIEFYLDAGSVTFGNGYKSALEAGYTEETAKNMLHLRPAWLSEKIGQLQSFQPQILLLKLETIIADPNETTSNKLRAIDMLMRHRQMYEPPRTNNVQINIQNII